MIRNDKGGIEWFNTLVFWFLMAFVGTIGVITVIMIVRLQETEEHRLHR